MTGDGSDPTYTSGDGIDITNNEISVNTTFTEASTRTNIVSGDTLATIFGKIKKWFSDLASMFVAKSGDRMSGNLIIDRVNGTSSTNGSSAIQIGNNVPSGTEENSRGYIELFDMTAYYCS